MIFVFVFFFSVFYFFFFFNDTATTEIYTLSLHDALPICHKQFEGLAGHLQDKASLLCRQKHNRLKYELVWNRFACMLLPDSQLPCN